MGRYDRLVPPHRHRRSGDQTLNVPPTASAPGPGFDREPAGLRDQLGRLLAAARRLVAAHLALARAEAAAIADELRRAAALAGLVVALLLFGAALVAFGLVLFLGEWLFGSMGWGVAIGALGAVGGAGAAALGILRVPGARLWRTAGLGLLAGLGVGFALGFGWLHAAWTDLGAGVLGGLDPAWRTIVAAAGGGIVAGAGLGLVLGAGLGRSGTAAGGGAVVGAIGGLVVGPLTAIDYDPSPAAGAAVTVGLLVWIGAMAVDVWRRGVDLEALRARYWPTETIETTKETIEWIREQQPLGRKS